MQYLRNYTDYLKNIIFHTIKRWQRRIFSICREGCETKPELARGRTAFWDVRILKQAFKSLWKSFRDVLEAKWFFQLHLKWASFPCKAILSHKKTVTLIKYIDSLRTILDRGQICDPPIWVYLAEAILAHHYYLEFIVHEIGCCLLFYQNKYKD